MHCMFMSTGQFQLGECVKLRQCLVSNSSQTLSAFSSCVVASLTLTTNSGDTHVETTSPDMESDNENMQALLERFSHTIDSCNVNGSFLEKLPSSTVHSSCSCSSKVGGLVDGSGSNTSTTHINTTHCLIDGALLGSNASCATSASLTPKPVKKLKSPDSDAGTDLLSLCRICQLPGDDDDVMFSPCRCSGSLKSVHYNCLLKWIDISTRKTKKIPRCELCQFFYVRHKRFKFHNWRMPRVSRRDKCLHTIFLITLVVMVICAVATVMCFLSDNGQISQAKTYLSTEEVITLTCGVMFFVSFFLAMTVEIKARHTIYRLFVKFIFHNTEWHIEPYDKNRDADCPKPYIYNT